MLEAYSIGGTRSITFKTIAHHIRLTGSAFEGRGYDPDASNFFWRNLEKSLYDAARITVYGTSRKIGRPLRQLADTWNLRVEDEGQDSREGGRVFLGYLPRLGEAAPQLFEQKSLFSDDLSQEDTVFDWLGDVTQAVWRQELGSARVDADLLGQLVKYKSAGRYGLENALIQTRRYQGEDVRFNKELAIKAEAMVVDTPASRIAKLKGFLNQTAYLDRSLQLNLDNGQKLRVHWEPEDLTGVSENFGKNVLVEGTLQFRPNGLPLILVADRIREATSKDQVWSKLPYMEANGLPQGRHMLRPEEVNPLQRLAGILDGQVDDETFSRMVEDFSRA